MRTRDDRFRALVVEPDEEIRQTLFKHLTVANAPGNKIYLADSADKALQMIEECAGEGIPFSLVICNKALSPDALVEARAAEKNGNVSVILMENDQFVIDLNKGKMPTGVGGRQLSCRESSVLLWVLHKVGVKVGA